MIKLDELTLGQIKEIKTLVGGETKTHSYELNKNYFIQTVTHYFVGKLVAVTDLELVIEDASWVADTGRFTDFLKKGDASEVEVFPKGKVVVGRGAVVSACLWSHDLFSNPNLKIEAVIFD